MERGGERDDDKAILDRQVKARIERYIKSLGDKGLGWTCVIRGSGSACPNNVILAFYDPLLSSWKTLKDPQVQFLTLCFALV